MLETEPAPVKWLCIDMLAVDDVDFSAAATLREAYKALQEHSVRLVFCEVSDPVRAELDSSGVTTLVGADGYYERVDNVLDAYQRDADASQA